MDVPANLLACLTVCVQLADDEEQGLVKTFFGDTVTLRCRDYEGSSPATPREFKWSCDSNPNWILQPTRYRVQGRYLTISAVQLSDAAVYRCNQTDDLGAIHSLLLALHVIPGGDVCHTP